MLSWVVWFVVGLSMLDDVQLSFGQDVNGMWVVVVVSVGFGIDVGGLDIGVVGVIGQISECSMQLMVVGLVEGYGFGFV